MPNITSITPPRVPLTDPRTGLITREWYRFFVNLFTLAGNGTTDVSLQDLLVSPGNRSEELTARVDEIYAQLFNQPTGISSELQAQIDSLRQLVLTLPRPDLGTMASVEQDNVRFLGFNTLPSFTNADQLPAGTMWWDSTGTLNLRMGNGAVTQQIGDELYVYGRASEAITEGQVIAVTGSDGTTGVVKFEPAPIGTTDANDIVGIATENIAKNGYGRVTAFGVVHGLNTAGLGDGSPIWYNPAVLGGYTITEPSAPNIKVQVGVVIKAAGGTNGSVQVKVIPGSKLGGTDSNVQFGTLNNGDIIQYDSALTYWKNVPLSTDVSFTPIIQFGGASTGVTYTTQIGRYTKIGRFVHLYIKIVLSNKGSSTGDVTIVAGTGSFPTAGDNSVGSFDPAANMAGLTAGGAVIPVISSTTLNLVQQTTTGRASLTDTNFTNTSDFRLTLCYAV
jgi:hypothetical protein